jgi:acetyl-CoA acyltransferase
MAESMMTTGQTLVPVKILNNLYLGGYKDERSLYRHIAPYPWMPKGKRGFCPDEAGRPVERTVLNAVMEKTPKVEKKEVEDLMIGCSFPEASRVSISAGLSPRWPVSPMTHAALPSTGSALQALKRSRLQAMRIKSGWCDVAIGGGIESMSIVPMGGNMPRPHPKMALENPDVYMSMGVTAENVANRYKISREMQDEFAYHSHMKAANAKKKGFTRKSSPRPASRFCRKRRPVGGRDFCPGLR